MKIVEKETYVGNFSSDLNKSLVFVPNIFSRSHVTGLFWFCCSAVPESSSALQQSLALGCRSRRSSCRTPPAEQVK